MSKLIQLAFGDLTLALRKGNALGKELFDRLDTYVEADPEQFPETFTRVLGDRSSSSSTAYLIEMARRLLNILDAHKSTTTLGLVKAADLQLLAHFELTDDEKERIAKLCGELRKIVHASLDFDQPHKVRLLNRIAAIEVEAQKTKGKFDVFLGGMSDFGETVGKFGTDSKPFFDRIGEIVRIGRGKTKEYEQLPPPEEIKKLPPPDEESSDE